MKNTLRATVLAIMFAAFAASVAPLGISAATPKPKDVKPGITTDMGPWPQCSWADQTGCGIAK